MIVFGLDDGKRVLNLDCSAIHAASRAYTHKRIAQYLFSMHVVFAIQRLAGQQNACVDRRRMDPRQRTRGQRIGLRRQLACARVIAQVRGQTREHRQQVHVFGGRQIRVGFDLADADTDEIFDTRYFTFGDAIADRLEQTFEKVAYRIGALRLVRCAVHHAGSGAVGPGQACRRMAVGSFADNSLQP